MFPDCGDRNLYIKYIYIYIYISCCIRLCFRRKAGCVVCSLLFTVVVMSREQSDGEGSVGETGTDGFVDATAETEVKLCLPLEVDVEPDQIRKYVPINSGAVNLDSVDLDPETQRRFGPLYGAKPKWPRHGFRTLPLTPEPHRQLPWSGAHPVGFKDGRHKFGMSSPVHPGLAQRRPNCRDTTSEANTRSVCFRMTGFSTPESG